MLIILIWQMFKPASLYLYLFRIQLTRSYEMCFSWSQLIFYPLGMLSSWQFSDHNSSLLLMLFYRCFLLYEASDVVEILSGSSIHTRNCQVIWLVTVKIPAFYAHKELPIIVPSPTSHTHTHLTVWEGQ